jgi:hypothetical protein
MRYDFAVKLEAYVLFVEDKTDEELELLKQEFKEFRITYNTEHDGSEMSLIEIFEGNSDSKQMLFWGIKENGNKEILAYYYIGDEDEEGYTESYNDFKLIKDKYALN